MDKEKDAYDSMPDLRHVELGESAEGEACKVIDKAQETDRKNIPHGELKEEAEMVDIEDVEMNMVKVKALFIQPEIPRQDREYNKAVPEVEMMTVPSAGVRLTKLDMQRESEMESRLVTSTEEMKEQTVPGLTDLKTIKKTKNRRQSRQDSVEVIILSIGMKLSGIHYHTYMNTTSIVVRQIY